MSVIPFKPGNSRQGRTIASQDQLQEWYDGIDRLKSRKTPTFAPGGLVRAQKTILHLEMLIERNRRD